MSFFTSPLDGWSLTSELSQRYRRDIFQVDPPDDPISSAGLLLAVLVVLPEAAAILLLLLQRRSRLQRPSRWYWREGSSLALVVVAGAIALNGVGFLDSKEHAGHAWRAAAVRHSRRIPANETEHLTLAWNDTDYRGRITTDDETLFIVARLGYRPHLTRRLLVITTVLYVILTTAVLIKAAVATWRHRSGPDGDGAIQRMEEGFQRSPRLRRRSGRARAAVPAASREAVPPDEGECDGGPN